MYSRSRSYTQLQSTSSSPCLTRSCLIWSCPQRCNESYDENDPNSVTMHLRQAHNIPIPTGVKPENWVFQVQNIYHLRAAKVQQDKILFPEPRSPTSYYKRRRLEPQSSSLETRFNRSAGRLPTLNSFAGQELSTLDPLAGLEPHTFNPLASKSRTADPEVKPDGGDNL